MPAITAEVSRSLVNYTYDWHQPRQAMTMAGLVLFGISLLRFAGVRWPARDSSSRVGIWYLGGATGLTRLVAYTGHGYDYRSTVSLSVILIATVLWLAQKSWDGERYTSGFAIALVALPVYAPFFPGDFLDRAVYAFGVALFGYLLLHRHELIWEAASASLERVRIQASGAVEYLKPRDIDYLKAAGNYTEVHRVDGAWLLDTSGLTQVVGATDRLFTRIHRSYAANMELVKSISVAEGSRYTLVMESGKKLPIGRSRVSGVRSALEGGGYQGLTDPPEGAVKDLSHVGALLLVSRCECL